VIIVNGFFEKVKVLLNFVNLFREECWVSEPVDGLVLFAKYFAVELFDNIAVSLMNVKEEIDCLACCRVQKLVRIISKLLRIWAKSGGRYLEHSENNFHWLVYSRDSDNSLPLETTQ